MQPWDGKLAEPIRGDKRQIALFGARSPLVVEYEESCRRSGITIPFAVTVDGAPRLAQTSNILELGELAPSHLDVAFIAAAFSPLRRRCLVELAIQMGFTPADAVIDPTAVVAHSARVGRGTFINAGSVIGALSMIGDHIVFNRSSSAGHHTVLANFVSIGPGVTLAGNIRVGEGSIIGAGSTILPDLRIGAGAIVAAGSVVRRHVPDGVLVDGNPARQRPFDIRRSSFNLPEAE